MFTEEKQSWQLIFLHNIHTVILTVFNEYTVTCLLSPYPRFAAPSPVPVFLLPTVLWVNRSYV